MRRTLKIDPDRLIALEIAKEAANARVRELADLRNEAIVRRSGLRKKIEIVQNQERRQPTDVGEQSLETFERTIEKLSKQIEHLNWEAQVSGEILQSQGSVVMACTEYVAKLHHLSRKGS